MNTPIFGLRLASVVFGLMTLGQFLRLLLHVEIVVDGCQIPVWWSGIGVVLLASLSGWMWMLSRRGVGPTPP